MSTDPAKLPSQGVASEPQGLSSGRRTYFMAGLGYVLLLVVLFAKPLIAWASYAAGSGLHSHIILIPFISAYLIHLEYRRLPKERLAAPLWAVLPMALGLAAWFWGHGKSGGDYVVLMIAAFVSLVIAGGFLFLGRKWMAAAAFPVGFLVFMIPLPDTAVDWLETASKLASAEVADWFFGISGMPVLRDGVVFQLPGIVLEVAQECSGIRSSWVLFITGLLAAHLFLKSPWRRAVLVAFVIPLGILRNGFRIAVIAWLCVEVGPHMIHSAIHKQGGPVFFAFSLIPLAFLLWWLRRGERRSLPTGSSVLAGQSESEMAALAVEREKTG